MLKIPHDSIFFKKQKKTRLSPPVVHSVCTLGAKIQLICTVTAFNVNMTQGYTYPLLFHCCEWVSRAFCVTQSEGGVGGTN